MFFQLCSTTISIALNTPNISAMKSDSVIKFWAKQPRHTLLESLNKSPKAAFPGF